MMRSGAISLVFIGSCFPSAALAGDDVPEFSGSASGFVVGTLGASRASISPGQHATSIFTGPMHNVQNNQFAPDGTAAASSSFFSNKARSVSNPGNNLSYAGSYWGDVITLLGGVGDVFVRIRYSLSGALSDADGGIVMPFDTGEPSEGKASVRWRTWFNGVDNPHPAGDPSFFLKQATDNPGQQLIHPTARPEPFNPEDNFLFGEDQLEGVLSGANSDELSGIVVGHGRPWQYGLEFAIGFMLETWASDGGVADFFNTGVIDWIEVPIGTTVVSEAGATYNVVYDVTATDFDKDGDVDGEDFLVWQTSFNQFDGDATTNDGDANGDGFVDGEDFLLWQLAFGESSTGGGQSVTINRSVPEPSSALLLFTIAAAAATRRRR